MVNKVLSREDPTSALALATEVYLEQEYRSLDAAGHATHGQWRVKRDSATRC